MDNGITPVMPIGGSNGDWGNNSFFWVFALLLLGMGGFGGFGNNNFANAIGYENLATSPQQWLGAWTAALVGGRAVRPQMERVGAAAPSGWALGCPCSSPQTMDSRGG